MKVYLLTFIIRLFAWNSCGFFFAPPLHTTKCHHKNKPTDGCLLNSRQFSSLFVAKPVEQVDRQTGKVVKVFSSVAEAGTAVGADPGGISHVLCGRRKSCGGFFWRFPGDKTPPPPPPRLIHPNTIPVEQVDRQTGKVVKVFSSVAEAGRAVGANPGSISDVLCGRRKSCGGFFWRLPGDKTPPPQPPRRLIHPNRKPVEQVDRQTGKVVKVFSSVAEAGSAVGANPGGISNVLCGRSKSCGGFFWRRPGDKTPPTTRLFPPNTIPVEQVAIDTAEVINVYPSMGEAARTLGISKPGIERVVNGQAGRASYKGFFWRKVGDGTLPRRLTQAPIEHGRQQVEQICSETGRVIAMFSSIGEAALSLNISTRAIGYTLTGIQKSTRGYTFRKVGVPVPFKRNNRARPVQQICLQTGNILATFPSQRAAGMAVNVTGASINSAAMGKNSKTSGGYAWRLVNS